MRSVAGGRILRVPSLGTATLDHVAPLLSLPKFDLPATCDLVALVAAMPGALLVAKMDLVACQVEHAGVDGDVVVAGHTQAGVGELGVAVAPVSVAELVPG